MNSTASLVREVFFTPQTQAIKYTGSKLKLLPYILNLSKKVSGDLKNVTVFDGFSGSTRISQAYAKTGYTVYANDIAPYTKVKCNGDNEMDA